MQIYTISSASAGGSGSKVLFFAGNTDDLFGKNALYSLGRIRVLLWPSAMFLGPKLTPGTSAQLCISRQAWSCQGMKGRNGLSLTGLHTKRVTEQQCWSLQKAAGGKRADLFLWEITGVLWVTQHLLLRMSVRCRWAPSGRGALWQDLQRLQGGLLLRDPSAASPRWGLCSAPQAVPRWPPMRRAVCPHDSGGSEAAMSTNRRVGDVHFISLPCLCTRFCHHLSFLFSRCCQKLSFRMEGGDVFKRQRGIILGTLGLCVPCRVSAAPMRISPVSLTWILGSG